MPIGDCDAGSRPCPGPTAGVNADSPNSQLLAYATTKRAINSPTCSQRRASASTASRRVRQPVANGAPGSPRELAPIYVSLAADEASYVSSAPVAVTGDKPFL